MIEAHVFDAWVRPADRTTLVFGWLRILAGFAAPLFLFLAGVSVALACAARVRATADATAASRTVQRRGWQIFVYAFLFRAQAYMLNPKAIPAQLLRVDILNIMGPAIVVTAWMWKWAKTNRGRFIIFATAALATSLSSAWVRQTMLLAWMPDAVLNYFRPLPGRDTFNFFPWAAFVFAGGAIGVLIEATRQASDRWLHAGFAAAGAALAVGAYAASSLPSPIPGTQFWTTSPAFFLLRLGILIAVVGIGYFYQALSPLTAVGRTRPMQRFGRSSLFVYWIHVELVYGAATYRMHHTLSVGDTAIGFVLFALAMYALVLLKDWWKARYWRGRPGWRGFFGKGRTRDAAAAA